MDEVADVTSDIHDCRGEFFPIKVNSFIDISTKFNVETIFRHSVSKQSPPRRGDCLRDYHRLDHLNCKWWRLNIILIDVEKQTIATTRRGSGDRYRCVVFII